MKPLYRIIESIPHGVILGDSIKEGPVTQVFKARFEGVEAMLRIDLPVAKTLRLNRIFEAELLESIASEDLNDSSLEDETKDEKAETPKTIKKINKIFSDFEALIVLIIKYFYLF